MGRNKETVKAKRERTDREKLKLFVRKADEMQNTRLIQKGFSIQQKIYGERGRPVEFNLTQPEESDLKDYLVSFRHFISEKEDIHLNRILSICHRRLTSDEMKQNLAQARQSFEQIKQHNGSSFHMNGHELTPLQVTDMYLNGKYFHNDLEHQHQLDSLLPFEADLLRFRFLDFVINASKIIAYVRNVVIHAFQEDLFQFEDAALALSNSQSEQPPQPTP